MWSWWDLGDGSGYRSLQEILLLMECGYCGCSGNYELIDGREKLKPGGGKSLNYQLLCCGNCGNYTMMMYNSNSGSGLVDYRRIPHPLKTTKAPKEWPEDVGRYWVQARRNVEEGHWETAAIAIGSAMQLALRHANAKGRNIKEEISNLATNGALPPLMKDWSNEVRLLRNEGAHPVPGAGRVNSQDVKDLMRFLDYLLEYLFTLPVQIKKYRERRSHTSASEQPLAE